MKAAVFHKAENISVALQLRAGIVFLLRIANIPAEVEA